MTTKTDLNDIERKARGIYQQDGLTILFAGVALAMFAIFFIDIRHGWVFALGITLAISLPELLRRQFVYPRVGYAQFLRTKSMARHVTAICLALICLILFYIFGKIARFNWLMPVYLGTIFSVAALIAARKFGLVIYYILAVIFQVSGLAGLSFTMRDYAAGWTVAFQLWGLAVILTFVGLAQILNFLRKHSKTEKGLTNGN